MNKIKWSKEIPESEGYYWVSYSSRSGCRRQIVPGYVVWIKRREKEPAFVVHVMKGGMFCNNNRWKSVRFGPAIPLPE